MDPTPALRIDDPLASRGIIEQTLTPAERRALDEDGYLVLPGLFDPAEQERLRTAFDRACEAEGIPDRGTRHPKALFDQDSGFAQIVTTPRLLAAVRHVLARPFILGSAAGRDPLPGFGSQGLHIDCVESGPSTPFQAVTALILLDPFTGTNGATRVVPGTHRLRRPPPKPMADPASRHPDQIHVTAPAGSILVFNGHLWHGGTANRSDDHRRVVQCSFIGREQSRPTTAPPMPGLGPAARVDR